MFLIAGGVAFNLAHAYCYSLCIMNHVNDQWVPSEMENLLWQDVISLGCLVSTTWTFDFGLQLSLPVLILLVSFMPYLAKWRNISSTADEIRCARNSGIASALKFLNVSVFFVM